MVIRMGADTVFSCFHVGFSFFFCSNLSFREVEERFGGEIRRRSMYACLSDWQMVGESVCIVIKGGEERGEMFVFVL